MSKRLLMASAERPLLHEEYLGEFGAVVVDCEWSCLTGRTDGPTPGSMQERDQQETLVLMQQLLSRAHEVRALLNAGGVFVVKLRPQATIYHSSGYESYDLSASTHWWTEAIPAVAWLSKPFGASDQFVPGVGKSVLLREPGNPFEEVLLTTTGYSARIGLGFRDRSTMTVLATNQLGEFVAGEIRVEKGLVFLLPEGANDNLTRIALERLVDAREARATTWLLPEESSLLADDERAIAEARAKREKIA